MNYKNVSKKKKKNTVAIVVASVLALVLAGGAVAGAGFGLGWFDKAEEPIETTKPVPTSSWNLEVSSLDDLIGVEFKPEQDFASYISSYKMTKQQMVDSGIIQDVTETPNTMNEMMYTILNIDSPEFVEKAGFTYGTEFKLPEEGQYKMTWKINGVEYTTKYTGVEYSEGTSTRVMSVIYLDKDLKFIDVDPFNGEVPDDEPDGGVCIQISVAEGVIVDGEHAAEDLPGYTLMISSFAQGCDGLAIETIELVGFERIGDIEIGA